MGNAVRPARGSVPGRAGGDSVGSHVDPHEYNGIAYYEDTVWATYAGTWKDDPQNNEAVISSNRMDWPPP